MMAMMAMMAGIDERDSIGNLILQPPSLWAVNVTLAPPAP